MKQQDIEFLKGLKKAIKEGDRCDEAEPAFWMIREGYDCPVGDPDLADEKKLINLNDCGAPWCDEKLDELKEELADVEEDDCLFDACWFKDDLDACKTVSDVIEAMENNGLRRSRNGNVEIAYVAKKKRLSTVTGAFLTYEDAKNYLARYGYNHPKDARPYALTAYRNPTFERLWRIITETDWEKEKTND